jgi:YndJ-like protein
LGLRLASADHSANAGVRVVSMVQPVAAICAVVSFWLRPGLIAAGLSVPWFVSGVLVAMTGAWDFFRREKRLLADFAASLAGVDLAFAGGWLVVSRAGLHPMGFQEPIVLLTSVHFHYSGFAMAVLAGAALRTCERRNATVGILRAIAWLVLFLPFLLAAGFVISPLLRMLTALALAITVPAFGSCLFWISRFLELPVARVYMRLGAAAAWVAMALAGAYAVTDYAGEPFLTMPGMASTHGVLNGVGFVMCSLLAFLMETKVMESEGSIQDSAVRSAGLRIPRKRPVSVSSAVPEFVARDFYDR